METHGYTAATNRHNWGSKTEHAEHTTVKIKQETHRGLDTGTEGETEKTQDRKGIPNWRQEIKHEVKSH